MSGLPKYRLIADSILQGARSGKFKIGEMLPTETELMARHGVSRATVRSAFASLRQRGAVVSHQGRGVQLISHGEPAIFMEQVKSLDELIAFAESSPRIFVSAETVRCPAEIAARMGGEDRMLLRVVLLRQSSGTDPTPLGRVTAGMDPALEAAVPKFTSETRAIALLLEEQFGLFPTTVHQAVRARHLTADEAEVLGVQAGQAALEIERDYATEPGRRPYLISQTIYAPDAVRLTSRFVNPSLKAEQA